MALIFSESSGNVFPELATFSIWPHSFLTCFSLLLIPMRLAGIGYFGLFLSPSPITGHAPAMERLAYASRGMSMLQFANDQNFNLCLACCIILVGFVARRCRMVNLPKLLGEGRHLLAASICQDLFMVSAFSLVINYCHSAYGEIIA